LRRDFIVSRHLPAPTTAPADGPPATQPVSEETRRQLDDLFRVYQARHRLNVKAIDPLPAPAVLEYLSATIKSDDRDIRSHTLDLASYIARTTRYEQVRAKALMVPTAAACEDMENRTFAARMLMDFPAEQMPADAVTRIAKTVLTGKAERELILLAGQLDLTNTADRLGELGKEWRTTGKERQSSYDPGWAA